jgi:hypothetical protein
MRHEGGMPEISPSQCVNLARLPPELLKLTDLPRVLR